MIPTLTQGADGKTVEPLTDKERVRLKLLALLKQRENAVEVTELSDSAFAPWAPTLPTPLDEK